MMVTATIIICWNEDKGKKNLEKEWEETAKQNHINKSKYIIISSKLKINNSLIKEIVRFEKGKSLCCLWEMPKI